MLLSFILALFSASAAAPCDEAARCSCFWNPMEARSEGLTARQLADADSAAREYVAGEALRRVPALERYTARSTPVLELRSNALAEEAMARLADRLGMRPLAVEAAPCPGTRGEVYHSVHFDVVEADSMEVRVDVRYGGGHASNQHEFRAVRQDTGWQVTHVRSRLGFGVCRSGGGS